MCIRKIKLENYSLEKKVFCWSTPQTGLTTELTKHLKYYFRLLLQEFNQLDLFNVYKSIVFVIDTLFALSLFYITVTFSPVNLFLLSFVRIVLYFILSFTKPGQ